MKKLLTILFTLSCVIGYSQAFDFYTRGAFYKSMRVYDSTAVYDAIAAATGTIHTITGDLVDNTDPSNPVIGLTGTHTLLGSAKVNLGSGNVFDFATPTNSSGILRLRSVGAISFGDWDGEENGTYLTVDDAGSVINYNANNGHTFNGTMTLNNVNSGALTDSLLSWDESTKLVNKIPISSLPFGTGTVTSVATGLGLSGGTITTSGTLLVDTSSASILSRQRAAATYAPIGTGGQFDSTYFWQKTGNVAASGSTFLGTLTPTSLRFRTGNVERAIIDSVGLVGIGMSVPTEQLSIKSSTNFLGFYDASGNAQGNFQASSGTTARQLLLNTPGVTGIGGVADNWAGFRFNGAANKIFFGDDGTNSWMQTNHPLKWTTTGSVPSNALTAQMTLNTTGLTLTGTLNIPTPFTLGSTSVTSTGTQLNYLNAATGTTGTTSTNIVFSTSPTLITPTLGVASSTSESITGTGGNGFLQIANQSSTPSTPSTSGRIYFDNTNRFTILGTNGFTRTFDGTANTANRVYTAPDSSGTIALMVDSPQHTYAATDTWVGTTAPSGAANKTYSWTRVGHLVNLRINIWYTVAGAALTELRLPLPADCPAPQIPTGYTTNDYFAEGYGGLKTAHGNIYAASRVGIQNTATTATIKIFAASGAYIDGDITVQYWVQ